MTVISIDSVLSNVVCGVDGSPEGMVAVAQLARLTPATSRVAVCGVWTSGAALALGASAAFARPPFSDREQMKHAVHTARDSLPGDRVEEVVIEGPAGPMLLDEVRQRRATLVAVGSHGSRRITGILLGGVATLMLHKAPCSVLISRHPQAWDGEFRSIVVGADGSAQSCQAVRVASQLGDDLAVEVTAVNAGTDTISEALASSLARSDGGQVPLRRQPTSAVSALVESNADLLIVGSRGLSGVRALGSVSERVAHQARCSVLVVR